MLACTSQIRRHICHQHPLESSSAVLGLVQQQYAAAFAVRDGSSGAGVAVRAFSSSLPPVPRPPDSNAVTTEVPLPPQNLGPWHKAKDAATGGSYYYNPDTGVATPVGAPKPDAWVQVAADRGGLYYWNKADGEGGPPCLLRHACRLVAHVVL
jgi:hypothetical protein